MTDAPEDDPTDHPVEPESSSRSGGPEPARTSRLPAIDATAMRRMRRLMLVVLAAGALVFLVQGADRPRDPHLASGASAVPPPSTVAPTSSEPSSSSTTAGTASRTPLPGFGEILATVSSPDTEADVCLLLADTSPLREQGLMTVTDSSLGGYDGMLFVFEGDSTVPFYMRNTPMPLSLAYVSSAGRVIATVDMAPCGDVASCPLYRPPSEYRMAVEVPQGRLGDLGLVEGATLSVGAHTCG